MTFAAGLRAILRQDPDVVMVGEIRDGETAEIAVQASLTGHLVLSTVHTNDAVSAVTRLRDLGVESFLLSTTLKAILAQRLVRRLCPDCKSAHTPTKAERALLNGLKADVLYQARGCQACKATGYRGRLGLYELVRVDDTIRRLILEDKSEADITAHAFKAQDKLYTSGLRHVAAGVTTLEEVMRVCRVEEGDASL
jgi:general secretion pathway protein E